MSTIVVTFVPALIVQPAAAQTPPIRQVIGPSVQTVQPLAPLAQFCQRSLIPQTVGQTSGTTLANFQALQSKDGPFSGFLSADTSGAAGLFAFGETINVAIAFFDKKTGNLCVRLRTPRRCGPTRHAHNRSPTAY